MKPNKQKPTMTSLLREALSEVESLRAVGRATGTKHPSLIKFLRGEQSLRLDLAENLAAYFDIRCERGPRPKAGNSERK